MPLYRVCPNWGRSKYLLAKDIKAAIVLWESSIDAAAPEDYLVRVEQICTEQDILHENEVTPLEADQSPNIM